MPTLMDIKPTDALEAKLSALEAADAPIPAPVREQVDAPQDIQPPATPPKEGTETPIPAPADAQPAAEKPASAPDKANEIPPEPKGSSFAKDQQRRDTSWKELNRQKEEFKQQQATIAQREAAIAARETRFQAERAKAQSKNGPEFYEQGAAAHLQNHESAKAQAEGFSARAKKLEEDGDYKGAAMAQAKADELNEAAAEHKAMAKQAKNYAEHLRKNPDPTAQQIAQRNAQHLQHYTMEAAKAWPELVKDGSEFQKSVVMHEKALGEQGIDVQEMPIVRYHVARLVAAEAAAGRVPAMEKELGQLRAKVKELELATAPGGGSPAATAPRGSDAPASEEDEGKALRQQAIERGSIR